MPAAFAEAPSWTLDAEEVAQLRALFARGAFVGMDCVRGKQPQQHFTMQHFQNRTMKRERPLAEEEELPELMAVEHPDEFEHRR